MEINTNGMSTTFFVYIKNKKWLNEKKYSHENAFLFLCETHYTYTKEKPGTQ